MLDVDRVTKKRIDYASRFLRRNLSVAYLIYYTPVSSSFDGYFTTPR